MWRYIADLFLTILAAIIMFFVIQASLGAYKVYGMSSYPNVQSGDYVMVDKISYHFHDPQRGDMVILQSPESQTTGLIKRIIGEPGDTVEIYGGKVYINGIPLDEPYLTEPFTYEYPLEKIPDDSYFVLGDNRDVSSDSHNGWLVNRSEISGKAWIIYWPPKRIQMVAGYGAQ